jgi:hypothetical protein
MIMRSAGLEWSWVIFWLFLLLSLAGFIVIVKQSYVRGEVIVWRFRLTYGAVSSIIIVVACQGALASSANDAMAPGWQMIVDE